MTCVAESRHIPSCKKAFHNRLATVCVHVLVCKNITTCSRHAVSKEGNLESPQAVHNCYIMLHTRFGMESVLRPLSTLGTCQASRSEAKWQWLDTDKTAVAVGRQIYAVICLLNWTVLLMTKVMYSRELLMKLLNWLKGHINSLRLPRQDTT